MAIESEAEAIGRAVAALNAAHDEDPHRRLHQGVERPVERVWCDTVADWVMRLAPGASAALRLAAHSQHLERWQDPRSNWPEGRAGYLRWRKARQRAHADRAQQLLADAGCEHRLIERVQQLIRKEQLARDPEAALLEDAACLTFLELDLADFAARHDREDVLRILRKTWQKMSPAGRNAARGMTLPNVSAELVAEALADG